jgi:uncharacterized protein
MENLLVILPFLVPVILANLGERQRWARLGTYALLLAINVGLLALAGLLMLNELARAITPELVAVQSPPVNWWGMAVAAALTSLLAFVPLLPAARRWLARFLPIQAESVVHTTALTFAVYQIGLSLGQMAFIGSLENLAESELTLDIWDVVLTGAPLTLLALFGVGLFVRRGLGSTLERLGLQRVTGKQLIAVIVITALLLGFDQAVNLIWREVDPSSLDQLQKVMDNLFGNLMTVGGAIALGLSAGISEELLFRGAVQPRLGLLPASVLFAVGHLQYSLTLATLQVFLIGLVLGLVRKRTNTTLCILIHASYNTVGVLMGLGQP